MSTTQDKDIFDVDPEILRGFISEAMDSFSTLDEKFVLLESNPQDRANMDFIFRVVHSIKGNAGFFNLNGIKVLAHRLENLLDDFRQGRRSVSPAAISLVFKGMDILRAMFAELDRGEKAREFNSAEQSFIGELEVFLTSSKDIQSEFKALASQLDPILAQLISEDSLMQVPAIKEICAILEKFRADRSASSVASSATPAAPEGAIVATEGATKSDTTRKTMRVEESTIDGFMNYIGELIIASEVFNYLQQKIENAGVDPALSKEFKDANISFNTLSQSLQKGLMEIRKVAVKGLFSKAPRLARDLAKSLSKDVKVELKGEELRIDKSILEVIEDPFVHMVRNSLDHGIELPDQRLAAGKPSQGTLLIQGSCDKSFFYLKISDDGAGIDPAKIRKVAVKKGLMDQEAANALSDKEAVNLIFAPGFSSAEQVSDVSGRGVGMDVVLTNIKRANGTVDVESNPGQGTQVTLKLPLGITVIVISALVMQVGSEQYVIPLENVREVAKLQDDMLNTVQGTSQLVTFRDCVYPLTRLSDLLGVTETAEDDRIMVLIEKDGQKMAVLANRLLGLQQVVIKNIGDSFKGVSMVAGAAILGDGRVGLVLDVKGLIDKCFGSNSEGVLEGVAAYA